MFAWGSEAGVGDSGVCGCLQRPSTLPRRHLRRAAGLRERCCCRASAVHHGAPSAGPPTWPTFLPTAAATPLAHLPTRLHARTWPLPLSVGWARRARSVIFLTFVCELRAKNARLSPTSRTAPSAAIPRGPPAGCLHTARALPHGLTPRFVTFRHTALTRSHASIDLGISGAPPSARARQHAACRCLEPFTTPARSAYSVEPRGSATAALLPSTRATGGHDRPPLPRTLAAFSYLRTTLPRPALTTASPFRGATTIHSALLPPACHARHVRHARRTAPHHTLPCPATHPLCSMTLPHDAPLRLRYCTSLRRCVRAHAAPHLHRLRAREQCAGREKVGRLLCDVGRAQPHRATPPRARGPARSTCHPSPYTTYLPACPGTSTVCRGRYGIRPHPSTHTFLLSTSLARRLPAPAPTGHTWVRALPCLRMMPSVGYA